MNKLFEGNIITFGNKNLFIINKDNSRWHTLSQNKIIGTVYVYDGLFAISSCKLPRLQQRHAEIVRYFLIENGFKEYQN